MHPCQYFNTLTESADFLALQARADWQLAGLPDAPVAGQPQVTVATPYYSFPWLQRHVRSGSQQP